MEQKITDLIEKGKTFTFNNNSVNKSHGTYGNPSEDFLAWIAVVDDFISNNYGSNSSAYKLFERFDPQFLNGYEKHSFDEQHKRLIGALKTCYSIKPQKSLEHFDERYLLNIIFNKFHTVVKQLRIRHDSRDTLDVNDEYDVQDLLHCLLKLHFSDIRKEEWTPSYAGGSSRMDFLLKEEELVIEVKKTRKGLSDKELGKQLIEDIAKYKTHPNCKKLICFTYDPDGRIINPKGIQNDLNEKNDDFLVEIIIKPD